LKPVSIQIQHKDVWHASQNEWFYASILDLSLGGVGILIEPPVDGYALNSALELRIGTPEAEPVRVSAMVRHRARGVCGAEFQGLSEAALAALRRAVSELLERGHLA